MKSKLALMLLMVIFAMGVVTAANEIEIVTPANGAEICGATYNVQLNTTESDVDNVTVYIGATAVGSAVNTSANQTQWAVSIDTTGATDSASVRMNVTQWVATAQTGNDSQVINVDNTGPVLSWGGSNTADKDHSYSEDFYIDLESDENLAAAPTVAFKDQSFTLLQGADAAKYYYDFGIGELRDDTYVYGFAATEDNTSCSNSQATSISREVTIYSKGSVAAKQKYQQEQQEKEDWIVPPGHDDNKDIIKLVVIGAAIYIFFYMRKKGKKR